MRKVILLKSLSLVFSLVLLSACGGGNSDSSGNNTQQQNSSPSANAREEQKVEESTEVTLIDSGTTPNVLTSPSITADEVLTFQQTETDNDDASAIDEVNTAINKVYSKNIILSVVYVNEDWMPYASIDGWTNAVEVKESESLKYYEATIWEETSSVHLYAFDDSFDSFYGYQSGVTDQEKIDYRESYSEMKFEGMPAVTIDGDDSARSTFLKNSFSEFAKYIVSIHPDAAHHLMYSGHGAPGGRLFGYMLTYDDAATFLKNWTNELGHNLGVVDMGEPCNKGSYSDLNNFCNYTDYYIASDLPNGGYEADDWTVEKLYETNTELQYHKLFSSSNSLVEVLMKRIDLKRKAYEYSINNMIENKVEQGNYLYSCSKFKLFSLTFSKFIDGKSNFTGSDDLLNYLQSNDAEQHLINQFNDVILYSANNKDFFDWSVVSNGMLMPSPY